MATEVTTEGQAYHGMAAEEVVSVLQGDPHQGLSAVEAAARWDRFGPNALPAAKTAGPWRRLLNQFQHPLIYILLAAGVITAVLGEVVDSGVIFGVVLVNALIGFVQESRAEASLDALRAMVRTRHGSSETGALGSSRRRSWCPATW